MFLWCFLNDVHQKKVLMYKLHYGSLSILIDEIHKQLFLNIHCFLQETGEVTLH